MNTERSGQQLAGRVVAISGASKGIGRAVAQALAGAGATVIGGARTREGVDLSGVTLLPLDVTQEASVQAFAERCAQAGVDELRAAPLGCAHSSTHST